jgi:hypothetical protein
MPRRSSRLIHAVSCVGAAVALAAATSPSPGPKGTGSGRPPGGTRIRIPDTWDGERLSSLQVPLAEAAASARHVSREYYRSLPVRPIFKSYDVYRPDLEPKGYLAWLRKQ